MNIEFHSVFRSLISFDIFCYFFHSYMIYTSFVKFIPKYFILFDVILSEILFLILSSDFCLLLFYILSLSCKLTEFIISSNCFSVSILYTRSCYMQIEIILFPLSTLHDFHFFSCLIALAWNLQNNAE